MSGVLDDVLVGLVLLAGFGYATYSLGPKSLRGALNKGLAALLRRAPVSGLRSWAEHLAARKAKGSCSGCDDCGSNTTPAGPTSGPSGVLEVSVPVSRIGKRH